jgi:peptidyl-prolyl cis-trans isomerase C
MHFSRVLLFLAGVVCLAQTPAPRTVPLDIPVKPGDPKPAVTFYMDEAGPPLPSLPPDKVVLTIGEEKITAAELDAIIECLPEGVRANVRGPGRREFAESLARLKALAKEARRRGIDRTPVYNAQIGFQTANMLAGLLYQSLVKTAPVEESAARAFYEQHKTDWERLRGRHILIRFQGSPVPVRPGQSDITEQEAFARAQVLSKRLAARADFAAMAKAESDDVNSGAKGGDLGLFRRGQMVPSFEEVAFKLPVGQVSEPVRSNFGYHIILIEQKENKTFEEVRAEVEQRLRPELAKKTMEDLRNQTAVTLDPAFYADPAAPKPPAQ